MSLRVAVLDYEMSNLRSAAKALERHGAAVTVVRRPDEIGEVDALVLPGDGHFGEAMRRLRSSGLAEAVTDAAGRGTAVLGICIGLQVLFDHSDEDPDEAGLGLIPGSVRRLDDTAKVPHIGWSTVTFSAGCPIAPATPDPAYYFLHSYAVVPADSTDVQATAHHGAGDFCAVAARGHVMGVQFHPEKSSDEGLALIERWIAHVGTEVHA